MSKLDLKRYEEKLTFLEKTLYIQRDALNELLLEAGRTRIHHNFLFDIIDIRETSPDATIESAHKVITMFDVLGDVTLQQKLKHANEELNSSLIESSRLGITLDLAQNIVYLDELPKSEEEEYTGRWALILEITAPNLDEALAVAAEASEEATAKKGA